ncbi:MAG: M20/M25/M40 family metallo-hydrolase [Candidatus Cryosericum sp.]
MSRRWIAVAVLIVALMGCSSQGSWPEKDAALAAIDEQRAHDAVALLASPDYMGRRTGTAGEAKAADWIASQFKDLGLQVPDGSDSYLSTYSAPLYSITAFTGITVRGAAGESFLGDRGLAVPYAGSGTVEADVVLAGFGVTMTGYDEYAGLNVAGKVVVLLRYSAPSRAVPEEQTYLAAKIQRASAHGAAGVIILDVPSSPNPFDMHGQTVSTIQDAPPSALVSLAGARSLFWAAGLVYDDIAKDAWAGKLVSRDLGLTARFGVTGDWNPAAQAYNVAGVLVGRDVTRQLLICAHHDHLGIDRAGVLYPGADDNASGVAVLIEVARSMSSVGGTPPISVLFVSFSGEEEGMLGSQAFVAARPELTRSLIGAIDLDMLRTTASGLGAAVQTSDETMMAAIRGAVKDGASLAVVPWTLGSDHTTFSQLGVPSCMLAGHGREAPWYHAATDTAADLPASDLGSAARDVLRVAWQLMRSS